MIEQNFIAITYRMATGESYTDTLHPSELSVKKDWLDKVEQINILPITATDEPQTLEGQPAKDYINSITSTNI